MKNKRFQLSIDTNSVFISQAPNSARSRVLLSNVSEDQLKNIARKIFDAGLEKELIELLRDEEKAFQ
ncbi:MAG: hypothetical protein WC967_11505 [Balneolaceae bacterium]